MELEKAEALFGEAEAIYRAEAALAGRAASEWAEAAKWHGVALFELKRRDEAAAAWGLAKALQPDDAADRGDGAARGGARVRRGAGGRAGGGAAARWRRGHGRARQQSALDAARVAQALGVDEVVVAAIARRRRRARPTRRRAGERAAPPT